MPSRGFVLLTPGCEGGTVSEYRVKLIYVGISTFSIVCVLIVLGRILYRHRKRLAATAIGRLVERLVCVQGICDVLFHGLDLTFALDCGAPPLLFLLTVHKNELYAARTITYNIIKEGFGLLSLAWHAHVAHCLYSWIVLKQSAMRLRRPLLRFLVFGAAAVTGIRLALFRTLREEHIGLYISVLIFDGLLVPGLTFACMRWYFLTVKELTYRVCGSDLDSSQGGPSSKGHVSLEMSRIRGRGGASSASGGRTDSAGGSGPIIAGDKKESTTTTCLSTISSSFESEPTVGRFGITSFAEMEEGRREEEGGEEEQEDLYEEGPTNVPAQPPSLSPVRTTTTIMSYAASTHDASGREGAKHTSIVRRLLRISFSVAIVWLMIAFLDLYLWGYFYLHRGQMGPLRSVFLARMVFMRTVGTVDAVMLGDLFVLCAPCTQAIVRFVKRLVSGKTVPPAAPATPAATRPGLSAVMSVSKLRFNALSTGAGGAGGAGDGPEGIHRVSSFRSTTADGGGKGADAEEAARIVQMLDSIHRRRYPARRVKSLEIFACTWNMGGCSHHYTREVVKQRLEVLLPQWLPRGYSLYVLGVQESGFLQLFREAVHAYLGGPEAFTMFGDELGDDTILHGFIAVTLFVKTSDVAAGVFHMYKGAQNKVAAGMNLGVMGHAANKGMVGLSCRYYDATLAIITAHFASDSKGRNRLAKRNFHACKTLQDLSLHYDSEGFAVNLAFRHTIVLGDLNFRLSPAPPEDVLWLLSRSARQMQQMHEAATTAAAAAAAAAAAVSPSEEEKEEQEQLSTVIAAATAAGATWRQASYARFFQSPSDFLFTVGNMPELPPCLGTRWTSVSSSNFSSFLAVSGAANGGRSGGDKSFLSQAAGESGWEGSGTMPRIGRTLSNISLFRLKSTTDSSAGGGSNLGEDSGSDHVAVAVNKVAFGRSLSLRRQASVSNGRRGKKGNEGNEEDADGDEEENLDTFPCLGPPSFASNNNRMLGASSTDDALEAWEWVKQLDELTRSMSERSVFHGFVEAPIRFPMSYRWQRVLKADDDNDQQGGLAGDYGDFTRLSNSYSTFVVDQGKPFLSSLSSFARFPSMKSPGTAGEVGEVGAAEGGSSTLSASDGGSSIDNNKGVATSARTPSYTDRILTHSLPGKASSLRWRHYDMADAVGLSDHRPVCAHLTLLVDPDCRGFRQTLIKTAQEGGSGGGKGAVGEENTEAERDDIVRFQIALSEPRISLKGGGSGFLTTALGGVIGSAPHEATVLFPLMAEDPLAAARKASSLEAVMPGAGQVKRSASDPLFHGDSLASSLSYFPWSAFPLQIDTVASLRFSEHLLLKISNGKGQDIGQAVIPVALGLTVEEEDAIGGAQNVGTVRAAEQQHAEVEPLVEGKITTSTRRNRRFRFPLTSGGALKGYISLAITTKIIKNIAM